MYMPLIASEDGIPQFIKQTGVSLEPGDILGILTLDDPSRVKHAKPFEGQLPAMGLPSIIGTKPAQRFAYVKETLRNILQGYDNQSVMQSSVKELLQVLRDPELPFSESFAILSTLSGRMPAKLETAVRSTIETAQSKGVDYPSPKLQRLLDNYMSDNVRPQDQANFLASLAGFDNVVSRYARGLKDHELYTLALLMRQYLSTEQLFSGRESDVVLELRDQHRDDPDAVAAIVLSHSRAASKNNLMLALLEHLKQSAIQGALDTHFGDLLRDLANLDSKATTKVALKAREVLITYQMPSLQERTSQMEQILKASVSASHYGEYRKGGRQPDIETLRELIDSRYTTFDVLSEFYGHEDPWVSLAALECYVRRAYRAYNMLSVEYIEADPVDDEPMALSWSFRLAKTGMSTPAATPRLQGFEHTRVASYSDLSYVLKRGQEEPIRYGVMFSADTLDVLAKEFVGALRILPDRQRTLSQSPVIPGNVINAVLRMRDPSKDQKNDEWLAAFSKIANANAAELDRRSIRRVSFMVCRTGQYPSYITLRKTGDAWGELSAIRDIEPALAYQLELNRLSNFNLEPCGVENHQIHVYYASGKENPSDARFFVRALVRPGRLRGGVSTAEYLVSETEYVQCCALLSFI